MNSNNELPPDLAAFRNSYIELFGSVPPLPAAKFDSIAQIDPESLRFAEIQRAHAFYSDVFDVKTTQLILFGMLLHAGVPAAKFHALAAHRAGASWEELQKGRGVGCCCSRVRTDEQWWLHFEGAASQRSEGLSLRADL